MRPAYECDADESSLVRSSVASVSRRSGQSGGWADRGARGRAGRRADGWACRNTLGRADRRALGGACRNTLGRTGRGAGRWASGNAVGRSRRNAPGNPRRRACSQYHCRRRVLAPRTSVGVGSRFIGPRRRDDASSGIGRVGRRPGEHGRSGAPVVGNTVLERTVGSAPDGKRHRLDVPVHRLLHVRLPVGNLTGKRWRTRARKVVHLRGLLGNCRVATDRARRGDPGGRKGQCSDTCRRTDDCDTRVKTSDQQADTSCNIALIHTQLHRPKHLRGYGPSWRMSPTASTCWPVPPCPSVFRPPCRENAPDFRGMKLEPTSRTRPRSGAELAVGRGRARRRSGDLPLFRRTLCRLSYSTVRRAGAVLSHSGGAAVPTGLEPATSGLTGRRELQTSPRDQWLFMCTPNGIRTRAATLKGWCPRPLDDGGPSTPPVESTGTLPASHRPSTSRWLFTRRSALVRRPAAVRVKVQVSRRLRSVHDSSQHPCPSPRTRRSRRGRHPPRGRRVDRVSDDSTRLDDTGGRVGGTCRSDCRVGGARRHGGRRRRCRLGRALRSGPGGGPGQPHRPARQLGELRRDPAVVPRQVPRRRQPGAEHQMPAPPRS